VTGSKAWIVTTSSTRPIEDVVKELTANGFRVKDVLAEIGSITGAASPDDADRARSIDGVLDISPDAPVDIGPPDSPETW
jgi:hypothetical protein